MDDQHRDIPPREYDADQRGGMTNATVMPHRRQHYTDDENAVLRGALERLIDSYGTQTHAARLVGMAQGTVSTFLKGLHGVGPKPARRIAQLSGTTLERLLGWDKSVGPPVSDPYANRHVAVLMARMAGLDEDAIRAVCAIRLEDGIIDREVLWWFDRIRRSQPVAV